MLDSIPSLNTYLCSKLPHDLHHVLDLIRDEELALDDAELIEQLSWLYETGRIRFAYEGTWISGSPAKWSEDEWKAAQKRGHVLNRFLRANYAMGIKKTEIIHMRTIMRTLAQRLPIEPDWGFIRYHLNKERT